MSRDSLSERTTSPTVSVVLPLYNGLRTVGRAMESLLAQDYSALEFIVVDDGSTDSSLEVVRGILERQDRPVTFVRHQHNLGITRTWNDGIHRASGDFILIMHQDIELLDRSWVTRAMRQIRQSEDIAVVMGYHGIPDRAELTFTMRAFGFARRQFHKESSEDAEFVTFSEFKCDLIRKEPLSQLGGFPENYEMCGQDIALSFRLRRNGWKILKVNDLKAIQRFGGRAETLMGNLRKDFWFGDGNAGVFLEFRSYSFKDLGKSAYADSRFFHRAIQPPYTLILALSVFLAVAAFSPFTAWLLATIVAGRMAFYIWRLWPDFRESRMDGWRTYIEILAAAVVGLLSDFAYTTGTVAGVIRHSSQDTQRGSSGPETPPEVALAR